MSTTSAVLRSGTTQARDAKHPSTPAPVGSRAPSSPDQVEPASRASAVAVTAPIATPTLALPRPEDASIARYARRGGRLQVNGIRPTDPVQKRAGDCFFMATLSAIAAARPELIEQLVKQVDKKTYAARFYDLDSGQAVVTPVTRELPLNTVTSDLLYARSSEPNELWPSLAEQAYAARYDGYGRIGKGGQSMFAMRELTGNEAFGYAPLTRTAADNWATLLDAKARRLPMTANVFTTTLTDCGVPADGLLSNHSYAVLDAYEEKGERWVVVRDPNASVEFKPGYDAKVTLPNGEPTGGVFKIKLADFMLRFGQLVVMQDKPFDPKLTPSPIAGNTTDGGRPLHAARLPPPSATHACPVKPDVIAALTLKPNAESPTASALPVER